MWWLLSAVTNVLLLLLTRAAGRSAVCTIYQLSAPRRRCKCGNISWPDGTFIAVDLNETCHQWNWSTLELWHVAATGGKWDEGEPPWQLWQLMCVITWLKPPRRAGKRAGKGTTNTYPGSLSQSIILTIIIHEIQANDGKPSQLCPGATLKLRVRNSFVTKSDRTSLALTVSTDKIHIL